MRKFAHVFGARYGLFCAVPNCNVSMIDVAVGKVGDVCEPTARRALTNDSGRLGDRLEDVTSLSATYPRWR